MNKGIIFCLMAIAFASCQSDDNLPAEPEDHSYEISGSSYDENRHFFLGHFFRDNYEEWHQIPQINSGVLIQGQIEVFTVNRINSSTISNFLALLDLGESDPEHIFRPDHDFIGNLSNSSETSNDANELFAHLKDRSRDSQEMREFLNGAGFEEGIDYVIINTARKLEPTEYVVNEKLGYISLVRRLQNDETLAVSYQYNHGRNNFQVGELENNYGSRPRDELIILKMLRPNEINLETPTWDLMMKNIYDIRTSPVQEDSFQLHVMYHDDATGQTNPALHLGSLTKDVPLLRVLGLDQLNTTGDRAPDGQFDFIPGITINEQMGRVHFPVLEPFGSHLESWFDEESEVHLIEQIVYDTLYRTTLANAALHPKNRFRLRIILKQ